MLNSKGLSRGSFLENIIDRNNRIWKSSDLTIEGNVLYIREGITEVDTNLDLLLKHFGITEEIKAVVLPKSLKTMDRFLCNNSSVELVIFNGEQVTLTCNHEEGTFENSNVRQIIIAKGFVAVDTRAFIGQVKVESNGKQRGRFSNNIWVQFYNSRVECITAMIGNHQTTGITALENSYLCGNSSLSWYKLVYEMHKNHRLEMVTKPIGQDYVLAEEFEDIKQEALAPYLSKDGKQPQIIIKSPIDKIGHRPIFAVFN